MGCASSKTTAAAVSAPTLLASEPNVVAVKKDGGVISVSVPLAVDDAPSAGEPAPEPEAKSQATVIANDVAANMDDEPATAADAVADGPVVLQMESKEEHEARGISVGGGCCGIGGGASAGCHGCSLSICGLGGHIGIRDVIDQDEIVINDKSETRDIHVGGGCCGIGGGASAGCHGCSLNICGLGGHIGVRDTSDKDEIVINDDSEARGINVGGGCCGIGGGASAGCHGCSLNICGLGGHIGVRDAIDEEEIVIDESTEARGISVGGGCCGIGGGASVGCHGCSLNFCGLGGHIGVRDIMDKGEE